MSRYRIRECCKGCPDHSATCHPSCEKYNAAVEEWRVQKEIIQAAKKNEYDSYKMEIVRKQRKRMWNGSKG